MSRSTLDHVARYYERPTILGGLALPTPEHLRVTFSGVYGSVATPIEIWSWGVSIADVRDTGQFQAGATAARAAWATHLAPIQPGNCFLTRVRAALVNEFGRTPQNSEGEYLQRDSLGTTAGTKAISSGNFAPLQTALCVSLDTDRAGATGKGRFFLPWPHFPVQNDFRITSTDADTAAAAAKAFLNAVEAGFVDSSITTSTPALVVASSKGYLSEVKRVRVGRAPDTMRSRRSAMLEGYSQATL